MTETLEVGGQTLRFLTGPDEEPCVLIGTIPPGGWTRVGPGKAFSIPGDVEHARRNELGEPAVK